ncbi:hypothetical protein SAMN05443287_11227 [Micromonospora phaseoli]|uniref:Right handed beta helix domain-containing protein n=1 Tax=Micromonospora phaseoli TaxID=1144548 RepID=A0A1H7D621_9ACTN|nr:right-handed parallel beta-helix repeat-containing protein [Micromonospora phaseoli]PZV90806.1 hypothetical protein CLV64_11228 [Micromonospora phaseoli]GIJ77528.1 hypothetical protein Xph01_19600 [Micromonospora phaseoli]SEJ97289.1 hypothetical protein SAMN05443287_11227 [Micromonospora phaseoli]
MSNYQAKNNAAEPEVAPKRRRKFWIASGVAGLTGVVSIAAVGISTGAGAVGTDGLRWSTAQQVSKDGDQGAVAPEEHKGKKDDRRDENKDDRRDDKREHGKEVPCDTDKLIQSIIFANENHGGVLNLAKGCTYKLTRSDTSDGSGPNGLPVITESVVLKGHDTKIVRDATGEDFRILNVGRGGNLTVKGLTIKGGQTSPFAVSPATAETPEAVWSRFSNSVEATKAAEAKQAYLPLLQATPKGIAVKAKATQANGDVSVLAEPESNDGAGVLVQPGGTASFEETHIVANQAGGVGGGLANFGKASLYHTTVADNTAFLYGGGIFNAGVLRVAASTVKNNDAIIGGGGIANGAAFIFRSDIDGGTAWIEKTEITSNEVLGFGGGLLDIEGNTTVKHSKIANNTAVLAGGGVAAAGDSSLELQHVEVIKNTTVGVGGGLALAFGAIASVEHSKIDENKAGFFGAGVFNFLGQATFRNSTINGNRAVGPLGVGGGIFTIGGEIDLEKTKVAYNFATLRPGGVFSLLTDVEVDDKSAITANKPTNCEGTITPIPNCFG